MDSTPPHPITRTPPPALFHRLPGVCDLVVVDPLVLLWCAFVRKPMALLFAAPLSQLVASPLPQSGHFDVLFMVMSKPIALPFTPPSPTPVPPKLCPQCPLAPPPPVARSPGCGGHFCAHALSPTPCLPTFLHFECHPPNTLGSGRLNVLATVLRKPMAPLPNPRKRASPLPTPPCPPAPKTLPPPFCTGRLNVLANVVRKPMAQIFSEFSGKAQKGAENEYMGSGEGGAHDETVTGRVCGVPCVCMSSLCTSKENGGFRAAVRFPHTEMHPLEGYFHGCFCVLLGCTLPSFRLEPPTP